MVAGGFTAPGVVSPRQELAYTGHAMPHCTQYIIRSNHACRWSCPRDTFPSRMLDGSTVCASADLMPMKSRHRPADNIVLIIQPRCSLKGSMMPEYTV